MSFNTGKKILVTGAGGFVGRALIATLTEQNSAVSRWPSADPAFNFANADAKTHTQWVRVLEGIDVVVHLAAHVHQPTLDDLNLPMRVNRDGTLQLAAAAIAAGVKRFLFVSTAKVFGEGETGPYTTTSSPAPQDAYATSKWEAELGLRDLTANSTMELVIVRPPLVYGLGAGANFARLKQLAALPLPLPIGDIRNRRDMIGIDNLVDLLTLCIHSPDAVAGTWLCSDGTAYSLADVISILRRARSKSSLIFSVPGDWVVGASKHLLGMAVTRRLFGNFEVNIEQTRTQLHWSPPYSMLSILQNRIQQ
ncbi:MAG: wcaG [Verrucomicrobiaceae bacterium]|nr:wcaG [Verrucomicrobiaceae bacterium]